MHLPTSTTTIEDVVSCAAIDPEIAILGGVDADAGNNVITAAGMCFVVVGHALDIVIAALTFDPDRFGAGELRVEAGDPGVVVRADDVVALITISESARSARVVFTCGVEGELIAGAGGRVARGEGGLEREIGAKVEVAGGQEGEGDVVFAGAQGEVDRAGLKVCRSAPVLSSTWEVSPPARVRVTLRSIVETLEANRVNGVSPPSSSVPLVAPVLPLRAGLVRPLKPGAKASLGLPSARPKYLAASGAVPSTSAWAAVKSKFLRVIVSAAGSLASLLKVMTRSLPTLV